MMGWRVFIQKTALAMASNYQSILTAWKNKTFEPIYLLYGEEEYFIDDLIKYAENNILDEGEKAFNQITLYGKEINYQNILDNAYQFPMMAAHRLVIVKELQEMRDVDGLEIYFQKPSEQTILILAHKHKKFDGRKKIWKTAVKNSVAFESKKIYENKIPPFISKQLGDKGFKINPRAAQMMGTYLGNDLSKIMNEINKLVISKAGTNEINEDDIHEQIGISKDYNVFELMNALGKKDELNSYRIANYFGDNPKKVNIVPILGALIGYFQKVTITKENINLSPSDLAKKVGVAPYFLNQYTEAARNYSAQQLRHAFRVLYNIDLKSKGIGSVGTAQKELLRELIFGLIA